MGQMINHGESSRSLSLRALKMGFFRFKNGNGKVFFASPDESGQTKYYPVLSIGAISNFEIPLEELREKFQTKNGKMQKVEVIDKGVLGIKKIRWARLEPSIRTERPGRKEECYDRIQMV